MTDTTTATATLQSSEIVTHLEEELGIGIYNKLQEASRSIYRTMFEKDLKVHLLSIFDRPLPIDAVIYLSKPVKLTRKRKRK